MILTREFYDELLLNRDRQLYTKIDLLNWNEEKIREVQGFITSGDLSIDGNSAIRRNLNISFALNKEDLDISEIVRELNINKKFAAYIGVKNNTQYVNNPLYTNPKYKEITAEIIWFKLGVFVPVDISFSHGVDSAEISISAQDKMVLLNGDIAGELGDEIDFVDTLTSSNTPYYHVIREIVAQFGGIDYSRINISDLPLYAESLYRATSNIPLYVDSNNRAFNSNGIPLTNSTGTLLSPAIESGDILSVQVALAAQSQEEKLEFSANDTVATVIEKVKSSIPGDYEYFFNVDGDFVFQLKKYLSEVNQEGYFQEGNSKKYSSNFDSIPYLYDFSNKDLIASFSNSPVWKGIKNDFYVYGKGDLLYHIAIDKKPVVPSTFYKKTNGVWDISEANREPYNQPWQQYIIDLTEFNQQHYPEKPESKYYNELKKNFQYDETYGTGIYKLRKENGQEVRSQMGIWRYSKGGVKVFTGNTSTGSLIISNVSDFYQVGVGKTVTGSALSSQNTYTITDINTITKEITLTGISAGVSAGTGITFSVATDEFFDTPSTVMGNPASWDYYFDIIDDSNSEVGQFSIDAIGRRIKAVPKDQNITVLYPFYTGDATYVDGSGNAIRIIVFRDPLVGDDFELINADALEIEKQVKLAGYSYVCVLESQILNWIDNTDFLYANDAYSIIKNLLYTHTTFNESISMESIPLYFLDVNTRINIADSTTDIFGDHYLTSISIPLTADGTMSMSGNKIYNK